MGPRKHSLADEIILGRGLSGGPIIEGGEVGWKLVPSLGDSYY